MSRPRSDEKRTAILQAATRIIVAQGLSAPTAGIAKEAGVANGSFFTYFETKTELFNQLYLELKAEMASAALKDFPADAELRKQVFHVWRNWMNWAVTYPEKRRVLAHLDVSDQIMPETKMAGHKTMAGVAELLERSRSTGPMRKAPMAFVLSIMNSVAEATMDFMTQDAVHAKQHCKEGFEALWRVVN
jgi:AcrR family transcriptional regulator